MSMSPKRIILWLLTLFAIALLGSSLLASFNQPQVQGRLELYQTNLLLAASEWQGDPNDEAVALLRQQVLGDEPRTISLQQYQQARQSVLKLRQENPSLVSSLGKNWTEEVTLKQGILEAVVGNETAALEQWQTLVTPGDSAPFGAIAQVLTGLWDSPPQILPQAETQIQTDLTGWFQRQSLQRLYQLQQRSRSLEQLQQAQQQAAESALMKLLLISVMPILGGMVGLVAIIGLGIQSWRKASRPDKASGTQTHATPTGEPGEPGASEPGAGEPGAAIPGASMAALTEIPVLGESWGRSPWLVPWDGETTWEVLVVGFFFVGQIVVSQILAPVLLLGLKQVPSLTDPANDLRAKAIYVLLVYFAMALGVIGVLYNAIKAYLPLPPSWFALRWGGNWVVWGVGGYLMALPLVTLTALINQQIWQGQGGSNPILSLALENKDNVALACFFATAAIAAPLFEEFLFRGFLLASLTRYFSSWGAIALSALIFSIAHLSLSEVLPLFVLGAVLGYVYRRSQNLLAPMLLHSLWNSATLAGLVILGSGS
nr:type II CAAX endopeptidase family protein [Prochlorothrix hollandica]